MQVEKIDGSPERRIAIGMIVSAAVLGRISGRWESEGLFASRWANVVGKWCVDYYARYDKAPGVNIEAVYHDWRESRDDDDEEARLVGRFLSSINDEYARLGKEINPDAVLDEAGDYFNEVKWRRTRDLMEADFERKDRKKALARLEKFQPVEMGAGGWIDPFSDREAIKRVFDSSGASIVQYKDGLGEFFGRSLGRECLIAILAGEKKAKSWWLLDIAFRSVLQGLKVAVFECGDLTERQVMGRFLTRVNRRPLIAGRVVVPTSLERIDKETIVEHEEIEYDTDLTSGEAYRESLRVMEKCGGGKMRLSVHANSSINVAGLRSVLLRWSRDGWEPDVVIVDYADILANPLPGGDSREQINMTWKQLRRMSQELRCLVATATQADADSYDADLLRRGNFSEDKRKYAHVTGTFGLNQTDGEKEKGLFRLNWLVRREEDYSERAVCHVAGSLAIANPAMFSIFKGGKR